MRPEFTELSVSNHNNNKRASAWAVTALGAILAVSLLPAGAAIAATVTATYTGISPGGVVSGNVPMKTISRGSGGIFNFTRTAGDAPSLLPGAGSPDNYFIGMCIEFNEAIGGAPVGSTHTWTLTSLDKAPVTANHALPAGMGAAKADDLRLLLGHVLPSFEHASSLDNLTALALQIAIWEIVHETSGLYDPRSSATATKGVAYFSSASPTGAVTRAWEWLDNINRDNPLNWSPARNIFALTKDGVQDYIVQVAPVPLPAAAWLLGSGLLGLFMISRRGRTASGGKTAT